MRRTALITLLTGASVALATAPGAAPATKTLLRGQGFSLEGRALPASPTVLSGEGLTLVASIEARPPSADVAPPFGVLDLQDKTRFMELLTRGDLSADLAPPAGVVDSADLSEFIRRFEAGQP
ncbi:MAG: GC-type dockerin domain-anchored protein [Phycisphaerales bacterium JB059]